VKYYDLLNWEGWLKQKQRLKELYQVTQDKASKTADNWVTKTIRKMRQSDALARK
jgi:hypothetical protein